MHTLASILTALFRPTRGLDQVGPAIRWLWIPLAVVLIASVVCKAVVAAPLQAEAQQAAARAAMEQEMEKMPEADRARLEQDLSSGEFDTAVGIANTAAIVFGVVGALVAIFYVATFFFIAAKTWAGGVSYTSMLSAAALMFIPHAIRNVIQAIYMGATGVFLAHPGLGALVAPQDPSAAPSVAYAFLSQIDIWVLWGLAIMFGALGSKTLGFTKKHAATAMIAFVAITMILQALPTIISGAFMGAVGA
ncbi:MAG: YIP1 family protein [Coriobacteriales bacterium]